MENTKTIHILIIKEQRKSLTIKIKSSSKVEVHAPFSCSDGDIKDFIDKNRNWINRKLFEAEKAEEELNSIEVASKDEIEAKIKLAEKLIPEKCAYYAGLIGVKYGRITLKNQKTIFGSCSAKGNLNFNIALMFAPEKVLDYIIIHELCHIKEMNHSPAFWHEVGKVMKDYEVPRQWLNDNGYYIIRKAGII